MLATPAEDRSLKRDCHEPSAHLCSCTPDGCRTPRLLSTLKVGAWSERSSCTLCAISTLVLPAGCQTRTLKMGAWTERSSSKLCANLLLYSLMAARPDAYHAARLDAYHAT